MTKYTPPMEHPHREEFRTISELLDEGMGPVELLEMDLVEEGPHRPRSLPPSDFCVLSSEKKERPAGFKPGTYGFEGLRLDFA